MYGRSGAWVTMVGYAALTGCGAGDAAVPEDVPVGTSQSASRCGPTYDFQHVESYDGTLGVPVGWVQRHEGAVGRGACSGTLISEDLFLSAGHCEYDEGQTVRFNYQNDPAGDPRPEEQFEVVDVIEQEDSAAYDYAIVQLEGTPGRTWGYARLAYREEEAEDHVVIIQHLGGEPKQLHAGPVVGEPARQGPTFFRHQVDTRSGSSGSGILGADGYLVGVHTDGDCEPGNSGMKITSLIDHSIELQFLFYGEHRAHGWVWADQPTSSSYTPSTAYQFSTGAASTVTRSGQGAYTVRFTNLGSGFTAGRTGNAQVSAYGTGAYCKVSNIVAGSSHVDVDVRCFDDQDGNPADSRYVAFYGRQLYKGFADARGTSGYVLSHSTTYASTTNANSASSANDSGGINTITQTGTGQYTVVFPGMDEFDAAVHVTAYGTDNRRCQVQGWLAWGGSLTVAVVCTTPAGTKANSKFLLSVAGNGHLARQDAGANATAYAWGNDPGAASYTPNTSFQGNDLGANLIVERSGTGNYQIHVPHPGVTVSKDAVLVTAYGSTGSQCTASAWTRLADETVARVRCFNAAGAAVDSLFTFTYLTSRVSADL